MGFTAPAVRAGGGKEPPEDYFFRAIPPLTLADWLLPPGDD